MHLRMPLQGRVLALEAGHALHEVFAFVRLASLLSQLEERGKDKTYIDAVYNHHGVRLFGLERLTHITEQISTATDVPDVCKRGAIAILDTSGYYDDPRDKRRTLSNMEEAAYAYINQMALRSSCVVSGATLILLVMWELRYHLSYMLLLLVTITFSFALLVAWMVSNMMGRSVSSSMTTRQHLA